jgi:hypothetical protein
MELTRAGGCDESRCCWELELRAKWVADVCLLIGASVLFAIRGAAAAAER